MIKKFQKNHQVLCTSRFYREIIPLAKTVNLRLTLVGKHGGGEKYSKLTSSLNRMNHLSRLIDRFNPDCTISFCSPEASRISYGLEIKHFAFSDSPHAIAVMKLSVPLVQKLLIPWIIPKSKFTIFGIENKDIIQYRAIDASIITKRKIKKLDEVHYKSSVKKTIVIRVDEEQAAYSNKNSIAISIIEEIFSKLEGENIIVLGRYPKQIKALKNKFRNKVKILSKVVDGKALLIGSDVFIGSGGTMTAEAALLGIPTISYNHVPNLIEKYLVNIKLVTRETNPKLIPKLVKKLLQVNQDANRKKAKKLLLTMEDPYQKLLQVIKSAA